MRRLAAFSMATCMVVSGCASDPDNIGSTYVSPNRYSDYNCDQVRAELERVSSRVAEVTGQQEEEATEDAVATGVGIVVFWPALFFLAGDDKEEELKRLKGQHEALEKVAIKKECDVAEEIKKQRKKQKEKREKQKKEDAESVKPSQPHP